MMSPWRDISKKAHTEPATVASVRDHRCPFGWGEQFWHVQINTSVPYRWDTLDLALRRHRSA
uniref:Uncharacterized protein n=1 Tax=Ralstonia solanacearum TaxID=305 RepID=A0A0S4UF16_RALSL|nr:protein of unknown function [Ralstonia solanacearum]